MCKQNSGGKEGRNARQQVTGNGFDSGCWQQTESNLPEMHNTMFMVVICWMLNGNSFLLSPKQLQAFYTNARDQEDLDDFIDKNRDPKEPYILQSLYKCTLE